MRRWEGERAGGGKERSEDVREREQKVGRREVRRWEGERAGGGKERSEEVGGREGRRWEGEK